MLSEHLLLLSKHLAIMPKQLLSGNHAKACIKQDQYNAYAPQAITSYIDSLLQLGYQMRTLCTMIIILSNHWLKSKVVRIYTRAMLICARLIQLLHCISIFYIGVYSIILSTFRYYNIHIQILPLSLEGTKKKKYIFYHHSNSKH